ncbi:MAG: hypothetical protein R3C53_13170 [Pirellulaceae bacterium]
MAGRAATAVKPSPKKVRSAAKATSRVKAPKSVAKAEAECSTATLEAPKSRKRIKPETRTRIYWAVFNQSLKRVAVFEFDQKLEAEKRASKLIQSSGEDHFIQKIKASVQV